METSLQVKHLQCYLAYGLMCRSEMPGNTIFKMNIIGFNSAYEDDISCRWGLGTFKPLLIPMSCIDKKIFIDGKPIIPIVELGKIAFYVQNLKGLINNNFANKNEFNNDNSIWLYAAKWHIGQKDTVAPDEMATIAIYPANENHSIHFQHRQYVHGFEHTHPVHNQLEIFQRMAELHIDFMGLIDAGLALNKLDYIK